MSTLHTPAVINVDALPRSLVELLMRELACAHARAQIARSMEDARRQLQTLKATRSPFFMLQSQEVRRDARTSQAETEAAFALAEKAVTRLDQLEPLLKPFVAYRIETYLRATSDDYLQALLKQRQVEDWHRWLLWFEHYSNVFRSTLALIEATIAGLPASQSLARHPQCTVLLSQAAEGARQIEAEVAFFNKIADAERRMSGPGAHTLYRQLALDWSSAMRSLSEANGQNGPHMISQFISQFTEISQNISRSLRDECVKPASAEALETNSFHARQWVILREAVRSRAHPGQFDEFVNETEFLLGNGRISELARTQEELQPATVPRPLTTPTPTAPANSNPGAPPTHKPKPALQLRPRGSVTGTPFLNTQPPASGGPEGVR